jgi:hypothetical protein
MRPRFAQRKVSDLVYDQKIRGLIGMEFFQQGSVRLGAYQLIDRKGL